MTNLVHLSNKLVNIFLSVTRITTLNEMLEFPLSPTTSGVTQFKWPQEVWGLFEIGTNGKDLVD